MFVSYNRDRWRWLLLFRGYSVCRGKDCFYWLVHSFCVHPRKNSPSNRCLLVFIRSCICVFILTFIHLFLHFFSYSCVNPFKLRFIHSSIPIFFTHDYFFISVHVDSLILAFISKYVLLPSVSTCTFSLRINQSINQSSNQLFNETSKQSVYQSINQSMNQSMNQLINQ